MFNSTIPLLEPVVTYLEVGEVEVLQEDTALGNSVVLSLRMSNGANRTLTIKRGFLEALTREQIRDYLESRNYIAKLRESHQYIGGPTRAP